MKRIAVIIPIAIALVLAACNQNIDLESIQTFTQAATDQGPAFTDLAADFYGSCQRSRLWRLIGSVSPIPAASSGMIEQQPALAIALAAQRMAQADVAAAVRAHNAVAQQRATAALAKANQQVDAARSAALKPALDAIAAAKKELDQPAVSPPAPSSQAGGPAVPTPVPPLQTVRDTGDPCQLEADAAAQWENANLVLLNYARALGDLAGAKESADNSYGFDTLAQELTGSQTLNSAQAAAFRDGAAQLTSEIFAAKRRNAIAANVKVADQVVNNWIDILESVANDNYRFALKQEGRDINHFFADNFEATQQGQSAFEVLQYRSTWIDELAAVDQRVAAINAYVAALEAFRSAHSALVARIQSNNFSDFYAIAHTYISQIGPQISTIRKAFAPAGAPVLPAVPVQPVTATPGRG